MTNEDRSLLLRSREPLVGYLGHPVLLSSNLLIQDIDYGINDHFILSVVLLEN